ncbi:hypothetical protein Bphy_7219 (plasmid) [Paraburkholderia phymatum STM815]|uniref:Uncharacterized protein n=1 Tax=Paraburkholderia phymatum (strain DSM 17167 / CIP 108236 / LMG 21445 / STM815) TaxID=391038 RepID=B2JUP8_PARP8|nr:hypothetical protein Bphy_7219 [Paraburkholderia phymatum STM815]
MHRVTRVTDEFQHAARFPKQARKAHCDVVLAAIAADRTELPRMRRSPDSRRIAARDGSDLNLQEMAARHAQR